MCAEKAMHTTKKERGEGEQERCKQKGTRKQASRGQKRRKRSAARTRAQRLSKINKRVLVSEDAEEQPGECQTQWGVVHLLSDLHTCRHAPPYIHTKKYVHKKTHARKQARTNKEHTHTHTHKRTQAQTHRKKTQQAPPMRPKGTREQGRGGGGERQKNKLLATSGPLR